ncbi:MAG: class A beta-lactamase-related serine hydrolase [Candidatus Abyssobacteria bacterium SURF_5]|uniref:Class A beta-lactamase-related serine hydrolase n=1 Tax=Abyssobacteria bacterium (strain SURF_5) TaxID=2093360 RepID=A0A3A4PEG9_ABYX5|nr:MAG: class A beta-lactamase-related serine hydrolase [Candidatus Abyssubacteria bacterium SURF_5]
MSRRQKSNFTTAQDFGCDTSRLDMVAKAIEQDAARGLYDGAVFLVARGGNIVMHEAIGHSDLEKKRTAHLDDVFFIMSITKQLTTTLVLMRIDRGELSLNTRISDIIPEFGKKGKKNITVRHLLTHMSGISIEMPPGLPLEQVGNLEAYVAAACEQRLLVLPDKGVSYNPFTAHALLAEVVRRLDGGKRPFREMLAEDLLKPLGMNDTAMGLRPDLVDRRVPVVVRDTTPGLFEPALLEATNILFAEDTEIPAGGVFSTAMDIYRFSELYRRGGEVGGKRFLSPAIVHLATSNHTGTHRNDLFDYAREEHGWPEFPAYLGLSFFLRGEGIFPTPLGLTTSPGTFAGLGAGSTLFWVDPERDLTFVCLTAGLLEEAASVQRFQRLSDLVVAAVVQ